MWGFIANLFAGPVIGALTDSYKAKLAAGNTTEAKATELAIKEIEGQIALRQTEASIIRQEQGWWLTALPRPIMGLAASFYVTKVLVYDLCLGLGSTPEAQGSTQAILMIVITGFYGGRTIEKVARIFRK